jgi:hypothetical protein
VAQGFIHTVHKDGQWLNEVEGKGPIRGKYSTKAEAVAAGKARAKRDKTEQVIHKRDGSIGERTATAGIRRAVRADFHPRPPLFGRRRSDVRRGWRLPRTALIGRNGRGDRCAHQMSAGRCRPPRRDE